MAAPLGFGLAIRIREEKRDGERRRGAESSNRRNPRRFLVGAAVDLLAGSGRRGRSWPSVWFRSERVSALPPSDRLRGMGSSGNALRGGGLGPSRALGHSSPRVGRGLLRGPYSSSGNGNLALTPPGSQARNARVHRSNVLVGPFLKYGTQAVSARVRGGFVPGPALGRLGSAERPRGVKSSDPPGRQPHDECDHERTIPGQHSNKKNTRTRWNLLTSSSWDSRRPHTEQPRRWPFHPGLASPETTPWHHGRTSHGLAEKIMLWRRRRTRRDVADAAAASTSPTTMMYPSTPAGSPCWIIRHNFHD
jgi:hypothetical protein